MNERLLDFVVTAGPIHLGDNRSRHYPIVLKLDVGMVPRRIKQITDLNNMKPVWYKATSEDKNKYAFNLAQSLEKLAISECLNCTHPNPKNEDHIDSTDEHVINVMSAIIETSYQCIPLPSKKKPYAKATSLPGWNEFVASAKDAALFWHSVWLSAQRLRSGQLYSIMCSTRNKYHYVVNKIKRAAGSLDARRLVYASQEGNLMLMKEIKKTLRSKKIKQDVPDEID